MGKMGGMVKNEENWRKMGQMERIGTMGEMVKKEEKRTIGGYAANGATHMFIHSRSV